MSFTTNTKTFFVTATDTGAGKTTVTKLLIEALQNQGYTTIGCKPVACGIDQNQNNEDVVVYQRINSFQLPLEVINPICLELPASPNIAAECIGIRISISDILCKLAPCKDLAVDYLFYEGAGGWRVPLNDSEMLSDLISSLQCPIILVVGIAVGCLNHALLTWEAMQKDTVPVVGWIANVIDANTPQIPKHIDTLRNWISAPYLGVIPFGKNHGIEEMCLDLKPLMSN